MNSRFDQLPEDEKVAFLDAFRQLRARSGWRTKPEELLSRWQRVVERCRSVYRSGLDDYTNDLSARQIIQDVMDTAGSNRLTSVSREVSELDRQFRENSIALPEPIFSTGSSREAPDRFFFYFRIPRRPGEEMVEDLIRMKLIATVDDLPSSE